MVEGALAQWLLFSQEEEIRMKTFIHRCTHKGGRADESNGDRAQWVWRP